MTLTANEVFRDYNTDGVPASLKRNPPKAEVRQLLTGYETVIDSLRETLFGFPSGRLSLSAVTSLPSSDITGAAADTLWYIDEGGGRIPIADEDGVWHVRPFAGALQLALDSTGGHALTHLANNCFDVFAAWDEVAGAVIIGTGDFLGNDFTGRALFSRDITRVDGIWVNASDQFIRVTSTGNVLGVDYKSFPAGTLTYLGTIGTVAAGQSEDSAVRCLVFNAYNPRDRHLLKKYTDAAYNRNSATPREVAGGSGVYQLELVLGLPGIMVEGFAAQWAKCSTAGTTFMTAISYNGGAGPSSTEAFLERGLAIDITNSFRTTFTFASNRLAARRYTFLWVETGAAITTCEFQPNSALLGNGIEIIGRDM